MHYALASLATATNITDQENLNEQDMKLAVLFDPASHSPPLRLSSPLGGSIIQVQ